MRIAQIVLPGLSHYELKSLRADRAALAEHHEIVEDVQNADVAHVYSSVDLPRAAFVGFPVPYLASAPMTPARWSWRTPVEPRVVVTPENLPEAVADAYFAAPATPPGTNTIGSFNRESTRNHVEQTLHRIQRFRDDVHWKIFAEPPAPEDLSGVDLWVDPAVEEKDYSGFVAEALVVGLPVVAARTAVNALRLEQGRTGILVPPRDPNEMTHAILSALFKPEVAQARIGAARQTIAKFRMRHRLRVLLQLYETLNA
ncbi:MAG TPA: glycosyltransferase [Thermoanaerobaculia bacterium]|nr:glycosyltransferase [Thermoanaerobaculia bacterium]